MNKRRDWAIVVAIVVGLILGELIKRVTIGLLVRLGIGLLVASMISNRRRR